MRLKKKNGKKKDRFPNGMCMADHTKSVNCADSREEWLEGLMGWGGGGGCTCSHMWVITWMGLRAFCWRRQSHTCQTLQISRRRAAVAPDITSDSCESCRPACGAPACYRQRTTDQRHCTCCESCRPACGAPACHGQRTRDHGPETPHLLRVLLPSLWSTGLLQAADHGPVTLHLL